MQAATMFGLRVNCARVSSADFWSPNLRTPATLAATMSACVETSRTSPSRNVIRSYRTIATQASARATLLVNKLIQINFRLMGACWMMRIGTGPAGFRPFTNHSWQGSEWRTNFQTRAPADERLRRHRAAAQETQTV